jgi:hypothetical protein
MGRVGFYAWETMGYCAIFEQCIDLTRYGNVLWDKEECWKRLLGNFSGRYQLWIREMAGENPPNLRWAQHRFWDTFIREIF